VQAGILIEAVGAAFSTNGGHNRGFGLESRRQTSLRQKGEWSPLIVANVQSQGGEFHAGVLRQIFSPPGLSAFDTARPTAGYLAAVPVEQTLALPISLVLDWGSELKK
jgi:hypothetical protein